MDNARRCGFCNAFIERGLICKECADECSKDEQIAALQAENERLLAERAELIWLAQKAGMFRTGEHISALEEYANTLHALPEPPTEGEI